MMWKKNWLHKSKVVDSLTKQETTVFAQISWLNFH